MDVLEVTTIVLLGFVLAAKYFTQMHTVRLSENLTVAENEEAKFRGRYKKVQGDREAIAKEIAGLSAGADSAEMEIQELETELYEIAQRNSEIKEQIESR